MPTLFSAPSAALATPRLSPSSAPASLLESPLELWGGVECTFNRVGENFFNQLEWNGHERRVADLDLFADLGMTAVRYPVIWERLAPHCADEIDWNWPDERLNRLRELNIAPIADLVHHGSGPRYAEIQSPAFAPGLAHFAGQIAQRYPWISAYTPVNEPLTTARFCGLYGHWFPHGNSNDCFVRILLNECRAVALSMMAIREVNSEAKLVQTDDLGHIFSTPRMAYQAHFENLRRWLTFDLLCGQVDPGHEMWNYLVESGASMHELDWFCAHPCPPDVIGINHYPTSDRYLDENLARYPERCHGENGRERYADVEAVRAMPDAPGGFAARLGEAWQRYGLPLAITEAHLGCTREEQIRWTSTAWNDAKTLREDGVEVCAVTAWSLLGAWNWNSLVTRDEGTYEPGVFDTRGGFARPTAIANLLRDLVTKNEGKHPVLAQPGWWQRPERVYYPPLDGALLNEFSLGGQINASKSTGKSKKESGAAASFQSVNSRAQKAPHSTHRQSARPILVIGARGALGSEFVRAAEGRGLAVHALTRRDIDIFDPKSVQNVLRATDAWAVINASGFSDLDATDMDAQFRLHRDGAAILAAECARGDLALACFSTDLVFDGESRQPLYENDATRPLNAFGLSKRAMEERVLQGHPGAFIARVGALFGPYDDHNFVTQSLRALSRGEVVTAACDTLFSPTYLLDLSQATLDLLVDGASGIWHLANEGAISEADWVRAAAARYGLSAAKIVGLPQDEMDFRAPRPRFSVLSSQYGQILPPLEDALDRYKWAARL